MKQVVQPVAGGPVRVLDVPRPSISSTEVLVQTLASIISPGTERAVTALAQSSLLAKAKARPDLVRQVVQKARTDGLGPTVRAVRSRLGDDVPLGYSACGVAVEVGEAVVGVMPGQLVATGGAGKASHAEFQAVPGLLCAVVPDGVAPSSAAFATLGSIALHGLRLAEVGPGSKVVVVGLGLVGQLAARLAQAAGCDVAGIDLAEFPISRAEDAGILALTDTGADTTARVLEWTRGRGADAVLVCAAGRSSAPMARTPELCRDRAQVVVVGDVGLQLDRTPFYERELSLRFARSYGPGRYEPSYEDWGVDYPVGHVRWTEGRNLEAVLDLLASGRFRVDDLVTHRFDIDSADRAYELIETRPEPVLAIAIDYPPTLADEQPIRVGRVPAPRRSGAIGVGWIGAGAFSSTVLLPAFRQAGFERFVSVASASGLSARRFAERGGFEQAVSGAQAVINDPSVDVVVVATPHDSHARLVVDALRAGKHVWCEKPLALTCDELDEVEAALATSAQVLFVGFNRRWSPAVKKVQEHFAGRTSPMTTVYRVAAGPVPPDHWYSDRRQGGRLLGEVCHFVDTCQSLAQSPVASVQAVAGNALGVVHPAENLALLLSFADGSVGTIAYSSAVPSQIGKEQVEVLSGQRHALVDDFRRVIADGNTLWSGRQDKGHEAQVAAFRAAAIGGDGAVGSGCLETTRLVLAASSRLAQYAAARTIDGLPLRTGCQQKPSEAVPEQGCDPWHPASVP